MSLAFVPQESSPGETRVAASPETIGKLRGMGLEVVVESGAGAKAHWSDEAYVKAGARIGKAADVAGADLVLKVQPPQAQEIERLRENAILVALVVPSQRPEIVDALRRRGVSTLAMDLIPRISRAQPMDALSSQATVAGYKAVLLGALHMPKLCPLLMTAAGTIPPAKVVVFGAGVAGLQAIATARRLGCAVEATDVRLAAREQVLSLGAKFIDVPGSKDLEDAGGYAKEATKEFLERQRVEVQKRVAEADLVVTTAQIPGRPAPRLIDEAMVRSMRSGAVIVDMAVESGGNCALSELGKVVERHAVTIVGLANLPASVPTHASELYAKNVLALIKLFVGKDGKIANHFEDEVLAGCLLTHQGEVRHAATRELLAAASAR